MHLRLLFILSCCIALFSACDNEVIMPDPDVGPPPDTVYMCSPDTLYFQREVLPVFRSSCGFDLCHDAATQSGGIVLENYESILASGYIVPGDPDASLIYQKITVQGVVGLMPPSPRGPLSDTNIEIIRKWIEQGAQNLLCVPDTTCTIPPAVSFTQHVWPVIDRYCEGCHSGANPFGSIFLRNYEDVRDRALSGQILAVIMHEPGVPAMPENLPQLDSCMIGTIASWVNAGAPNN